MKKINDVFYSGFLHQKATENDRKSLNKIFALSIYGVIFGSLLVYKP